MVEMMVTLLLISIMMTMAVSSLSSASHIFMQVQKTQYAQSILDTVMTELRAITKNASSYIFLALKGRCKGCKSQIPVRDFWSEMTGGAAFCGCVLSYGCGSSGILSLKGAVIFAYLGILLVVARIDWDTQIIYDRFHILILLLGVAALWLFPEHGMVDRLIGAVIISVPMLLLALIIPGAFGGGDIKLMAASGFFLGTGPVVCAMFFGLLTGGGYGAAMLLGKKLEKKDHFAFGPFLAFGLALAVFFGDQIVNWYLSLLS